MHLGSGALFRGLEGGTDLPVHQGLKRAVVVHHRLLFLTTCGEQERAERGQLGQRATRVTRVQGQWTAPRSPSGLV